MRHAAGIDRQANHVAFVVQADGGAADIIMVKRAQVQHAFSPGPQEGVKGCVVLRVRNADDFTFVVDIESQNSGVLSRSAETAKVGHGALLPEQGVTGYEVNPEIRVVRAAISRRTDDVAVVVEALDRRPQV